MSTSQRRTAFARTPRNPGATQSGSGQNGNLIRINKSFLDRMTQARIESETSTVLTKCEAELALTIGANGKGNYNVVQKTGRTIGDAADVMKVQSLGSFINEERKSVLKSSVSGQTQKALAAIVQRCQDTGRNFVRFPRSFLDAFRAISNQMDTLAANVTAITALEASGAANEGVREHLLSTATRIRAVVGEYILYRACLRDEDVPEKINSRLRDAGILVWVFTRLTAQKMQLGGKDFEFRRVYFPKDPTKGLQITLREWNTPSVKNNQGVILSGCRYTCSLWDWANARQFLGFPAGEADFDNAHKAVANVPLLAVPPPGGFVPQEIFSALGKSGDRGLPWSVGTTTKPQDTMKFLGTVPKKIFLGIISRPALKTATVQAMYPGYDPTAEGEGVYAKLFKQSKQVGFDESWPRLIARGASNRIATMRTVAKDLIGVTDGDFAQLVNAACNSMVAPDQGEGLQATDVWAEIMATKVAITDARAQELLANRADTSWFLRKRKSKDIDYRSARSQLGEGGAALIVQLQARRYRELAVRVEAWLRTFLTTDIQTAVAEVILAKLDASLSRPIEFGRDERVAVLQPVDGDSDLSESDEDEADQEANPDEE